MTNEDLKRFYKKNPKINESFDFVRLDEHGKISSTILPSYVDDVIEGYYHDGKFYKNEDYTDEIPGEKGKIYLDLATNNSYRWAENSEQFVLVGGGGEVNFDETMRISFGYNLVINSNGAQFGGTNSGYQWNDLNEWGVYPGYDVKGLCYRDEIVQDEDVFRQYMKFMTGSEYLPEYNRDEPHDTYIYLSSSSYDVNSKVWKLQYSHVEFQGQQFNVLLAFKVTQFPFALKEEIPIVSPYPYTEENGGTIDTDNNRVEFELDNSLLSNGRAINAQILIKDTSDNVGTMFVTFVRVYNSFEPTFESKSGIAEYTSQNYEFDYSSNKFYIRLIPDGQNLTLSDIQFTLWNITLFANS